MWPDRVLNPGPSINTKMKISQESLVEIDRTLCRNFSCMKPFDFFLHFGIQRWPPFAITKNSTERENDNISISA